MTNRKLDDVQTFDPVEAAAPDLLAALEGLVAAITAPPTTGMTEINRAAKRTIALTAQARAAIAKARNQ